MKLKLALLLLFLASTLLYFLSLDRFPITPITPITLIATGDVMLGRAVNSQIHQRKDFTYPFQKTADFLKGADLTIVNLEAPFVENCPITNMGMVFCADTRSIEGLKLAGVDIVSLANNHTLNYGQKGLTQTINLLKENKIQPIGNSMSYITRKKGTTLGFLGFDLIDPYDQVKILQSIKELKTQVDIVIVSLHWGVEYAQKPTKSQIDLAHLIIDAGADLIIGTHPHVIQPTEEYKGKLIVYSLGNFIFDQPWSEETKKGLVGKFTFQNKKLINSEFKKVYISNSFQPTFLPD